MSGLGDNMKGKAKQVIGGVTGDEQLEAEGKLDQVVGNLKDRAKEVKDSVMRDVNDGLDAAKEKTDNHDDEE